jgi:competence protein ComEC
MTTVAETTRVEARPTSQADEDGRVEGYCRQMLLWLPLVPVAVGMATGIVLDRFVPVHWGVCVGAFGLAGVMLAIAFRAERWAAVLAVGALVSSAAAVGALRHQVAFWRLPAEHVFNFLRPRMPVAHAPSLSTPSSAPRTLPPEPRTLTPAPGTPSLARLRGCIASEPVIREAERRAYGLPTSDKPRTSFLLETEQILTPAGWVGCCGLVRVGVRGAASHVRLGDDIEIYASQRLVDGPRNPGEYDWRMYNRRSGLYVAATVDQPQSIMKLPEAGGGWSRRLLGKFRQGCQRALLDGIVAEEPTAGLLSTYVAGQRSAVSRQINEAFRRSGTAHLLAVSGSHVALIATFGGFVGWLVLGRPRRAALVAFVAVIFFSLLAEANAPALRSAIMAILAVSALFAGRPFNSGNWLAGSAVVLLAIGPAELFSPAFQMTFAAVIALILLTRAICTTLFGPRDLAGWIRLQIRLRKGVSWWYAISLSARNAFSYSVAAWLANVPLAAWHFGQFNPYGPIATVLITPLATITLILGFCKMLLGLVWPSVGSLLARPLEGLADWMARSAEWLGSWPGASMAVPAPPAWLVVVTYAVLAYWAVTMRQRWYAAWPIADRMTKSLAVPPIVSLSYGHGGLIPVGGPSMQKIYNPIRVRYVVAVAAALMGIYALTIRLGVPDHLRLHVLSVGDGLCVVVRCPEGKNLLYDCGSITVSGVGERVVVPALQALGVRQIDAVVLSHANLDHYSGLIEVAEAMPIGAVWLNEDFRRDAAAGLPKQLLKDLKARGIPLKDVAAGTEIGGLGPARAEVLWPPADLTLPGQGENDASVVVRVSWGTETILLTGDIGPFAQRRLVRDNPGGIRADVLLLPHHGRTRTLDPDFVPAVGPQVAIASTALAQRPNQPALAIPPGCQALDTQTGGMVTVDLPATGPRVGTFVASPVSAIR